MTKYAQIDTTGIPIAFYDDKIHKTIPKDVIVISDLDWQDHVSGKEKVWNGSSWVDYIPPPPPPIPLSEYKSNAKEKVIQYAINIEKELTAGHTQGEVASWPVKLNAAYAYLANTANNAQKIMIETEATEKNILPNDLCNIIIIKGEWYSEAIALIASLRSNTFNAIDAATTETKVDQALQDALSLANQKWIDLISRMP